MVEFVDGSTMLQASPPDMKLPIALGLAWPDRLAGAANSCDWTEPVVWKFSPLDNEAFPAVMLARKAGEFAKTAPAVLNAANEVCVDAFIAGDLDFLDIVDTVDAVVTEHINDPDVKSTQMDLSTVLAADTWARTRARDASVSCVTSVRSGCLPLLSSARFLRSSSLSFPLINRASENGYRDDPHLLQRPRALRLLRGDWGCPLLVGSR